MSQETGPPRGSGRASQHSGEEIYGKDLLKDHSPADAYTQLPVLPDGGLVSAQLLKPPVELHTQSQDIGEGNGNPLQCSCLENPRDGGAWWAAVYGVTQSPTRLK